MESANLLPENDQDLILAKELGRVLESGKGTSEFQDSLIQFLLDYRTKELHEITKLSSESDDIWNNVYKETTLRQHAAVTPLTKKSSNTWIWAAAATVLIAAFLGIFWLVNPSQPNLIASSGSGIKMVQLSDGSQISLRPNSELYEVNTGNNQRAYKINGEAFFTVAKDAERPFSVQAGIGTITVLGTRFNVSTWGNKTSVFLEEGSVRLESNNVSPVILKPGEKAEISERGISAPETAEISNYTDWLQNTITLNRTPLRDVISELEHHFNITIDISQAETPDELISGSISLQEISSTLSDLGVILGGAFREVNAQSFSFIPLN